MKTKSWTQKGFISPIVIGIGLFLIISGIVMGVVYQNQNKKANISGYLSAVTDTVKSAREVNQKDTEKESPGDTNIEKKKEQQEAITSENHQKNKQTSSKDQKEEHPKKEESSGKPSCEPSKEICDGKDDDCDGAIDEDLTKQCGDSDTGACQFGTSICQDGKWSECTGAIKPTKEICDQKDNDCDGQTDENGVCDPCIGVECPVCQYCSGGKCIAREEGYNDCGAGCQRCVDGSCQDYDPACSEGKRCRSDECISNCEGTDTSCGISECVNCNEKDRCSAHNYVNYYCAGSICNYNIDNCSDCSCSCGGYHVEESNSNENCDDNKDNDCDGDTDLEDSGCALQPKKPSGNSQPYLILYQDSLGNVYKKNDFKKEIEDPSKRGFISGTSPVSSDKLNPDREEVIRWIKDRSLKVGDVLIINLDGVDDDGDEVFYKVTYGGREDWSYGKMEVPQEWSSNTSLSLQINNKLFNRTFENKLGWSVKGIDEETNKVYWQEIQLNNIGELNINICFNDKPQQMEYPYGKQFPSGCVRFKYFINKPGVTYFSPVAIISPLPQPYIQTGEEVEFNGSKSFSIENRIIKYSWERGLKEGKDLKKIHLSFSSAGTHTVTLTITDSKGHTATAQLDISVVSNE